MTCLLHRPRKASQSHPTTPEAGTPRLHCTLKGLGTPDCPGKMLGEAATSAARGPEHLTKCSLWEGHVSVAVKLEPLHLLDGVPPPESLAG